MTATSANMPQAKKCLGRFHSCSLMHFASFPDASISDIRYKDSLHSCMTTSRASETRDWLRNPDTLECLAVPEHHNTDTQLGLASPLQLVLGQWTGPWAGLAVDLL